MPAALHVVILAAGEGKRMKSALPKVLLPEWSWPMVAHVIDALRAQCGRMLPAALLTGDGSDALKLAAREHGCRVLTKPVRPASLRAFLAAQRQAVQA